MRRNALPEKKVGALIREVVAVIAEEIVRIRSVAAPNIQYEVVEELTERF